MGDLISIGAFVLIFAWLITYTGLMQKV